MNKITSFILAKRLNNFKKIAVFCSLLFGFGMSFGQTDDFTDGNFTANPVWSGNTADFTVETASPYITGGANTDGNYLASVASKGNITLSMPSTEVNEWQFSLGTGSFNPSGSNYFGVILMSNVAVTGSITATSWNGYFLKIGIDGATVPIELWKKNGAGTGTKVGSFPSSPNYNGSALNSGLNIRVTRNASGKFELFYSTGFTYSSTPTTSAGTVTDTPNTITTSAYFGVFQFFVNTSASKRVFLDNVVLGTPAAAAPVVTGETVTGNVGTAITNYQINATNAPTSYAIVSGTLPTGLSLNTGSGVISGTPTTLGTSSIEVTATNAIGTSSPAATITFNIAKGNQTITFAALANKQYGDAAFTLGGTASSGLPVTYTSSDPLVATISGNTVTVVGLGSTNITASQGGDTNYNAATDVVRTLTVTERVLTIKGLTANNKVQDGNTTATLLGTATLNGVIGSDDVTLTGTPTATFATSNVGTAIAVTVTGYSLTGTKAANYTLTQPTGLTANITALGVPIATGATAVLSDGFSANWNAVTGATGYELDVYTLETGANATDLFISEYVEGSSNNKYIEIYNGTGASVDLSDYELRLYANGASTPQNSNVLTGTLANNSTIVYSNSGATIYSGTTTDASAANFNGDDAIALYKISTASFVDIFGRIGNDPGSKWTGAGGYSTENKTLVRKSSVTGGITVSPTGTGATAFTTLTTEWDLYDEDNISNLGSHAFDGGTTITFVSGYENLNVGNVTSYEVTGLNPNTTYYYVVRAILGTNTSANSNVIEVTTTKITKWTGSPAAWDNGEPTATVNAIIDADYNITTNITAKDLTVNSPYVLTIKDVNTLSVKGNLTNNGSIVFESTAAGTGSFAAYNGVAIAAPVTVERFVTGRRAFRFLAPAVNTTESIKLNWQAQTHITGGGISQVSVNGFDATNTGNPSMYTYGATGWVPIANTDVLKLNATTGYRMLVRGDRTSSLITAASLNDMNVPITLKATGTLVSGDVIYNALSNTSGYTLVANPYASPIDWSAIERTGITDAYQVWDPKLGTAAQRGRYVSCDVNGTASILESLDTPTVNKYIQTGQAFLIKNAVLTTPGSITIKEAHKVSNYNYMFRANNTTVATTSFGKLGVSLFEALPYSLGDYPIDGAVAVSNENFNTALDGSDVAKLLSSGEQVAFKREGTSIGIEKVGTIQTTDELAIATINLVANKEYVWEVTLQNNFTSENIYLLDTFTQEYHPVANDGTTTVTFNTNTGGNAIGLNRFKIVFQTTVLSTPTFANKIVLYPNPAKSGSNAFYLEGISATAKVSVHNLLGQEFPIQTSAYQNGLQVQGMSPISAGVYIVNVSSEGNTAQIKWIVE